MTAPSKNRSYDPLRILSFLGILIGFALVILGWILIPTTDPLSIVAACLILCSYGLVNYFTLPRIQPEILRWASIFGLVAGIIFVGEILLEYIILPKDNTIWGLIEFGSVFALYFFAGLWVSYRSVQIRSGIVTAILSAMISALIWLIAVLVIFYVFRGTDRQTQVLIAEGTFEDIARSGMTDFNAFVMEDLLGGGFFHLLLGPIVATILGGIGGITGKGIAKIRKPC